MSIYLDYAATAPVSVRVQDVVSHYLVEEFGNAGSRSHRWGNAAKKIVASSRELIANVVGSGPEQLIFTSGATESNNIAILGLAPFGIKEGRRHIVTSAAEHKSVLEPMNHLAEQGFEVEFLRPDANGLHSVSQVSGAMREDTLLVSIMQVNNETGVVQPIRELAEYISQTDAYFHVDAAQSFAKVSIPELESPIDLISISGHKIGAPKGIGGLFVRRRGWRPVPLTPLMYGGGQERKLRPGTLPVALIAGFAEAVRERVEEHDKWTLESMEFNLALRSMSSRLGGSAVGDPEKSAPHILNLSFPGIDAEALIVGLQSYAGFSTGSACTSASYTPSHVLEALDMDPQRISESVRFSWWGDPSMRIDELEARIASLRTRI